MADNRPPHRPTYHRAGSGERYPDDRERANKARQAAEALFAPKPQESAPTLPSPVIPGSSPGRGGVERAAAPPTAERRAPARHQALPAPVRKEPDASPGGAPAVGAGIPPAQVARIRTWLRYGMTIAEVAAVYGVGVGDIERLLGKA